MASPISAQLKNAAYLRFQEGKPAEAEELCRRALQQDPRNADCVYLLAVIAQESGHVGQALQLHDRVQKLSPDNAVFINARGEALLALGRRAEAMQAFGRAVSIRPTYERAHNNIGRLLHAAGDYAGARKSLAEAVRLNPRYSTAHNNLGAALQSAGQFAEAADHFRKALAIKPDYPEALYNLGACFNRLGEPLKALESLQEAVRLRPQYVQAHTMIGQTLLDMAQVAASVESFQTAVRLRPDEADRYLPLGNVLLLLGRMEEAAAAYDQGLKLRPDFPDCFAQRFLLRQQVCDWDSWDADVARLDSDAQRAMDQGHESPVHPLYASSLPWSGEMLLRAARMRAGHFQRFVERALPPASASGEGRIKVGYLSGDFYDHPVGHLVQGLFGLHDRAEFEIHAYSFGPNDLSPFRVRIERECEFFHDVRRTAIPELAQRIRDDGIQILVDLMGYTGIGRTGCVAMRPAPIQVNWLGFPCSMGADFVDYMIGDPVVTPAQHAAHYHEKLVRLPHSFIIGESEQDISEEPVTRAQQGLPDDAVVFCCFNNAHKIDPTIFDVWMRILSRVPGSVAWLGVRQKTAQENLLRRAQSRGIEAKRLVFSAHVASKAEHLARHRLADLFLDTRYYNAHATACDALWAGLPMLSCPGGTFASRVGASLLTAVGLGELIVPDLAEYERRAIELAGDRAALGALHSKLEGLRASNPLFDARRFVANLERAYRMMWETHVDGRPAQAIDVVEPENGCGGGSSVER